jgi:GT2 family glycosyltransferase/SAM-dependent methyltransferase
MKVSVIIPTKNRRRYLEDCLKSLVQGNTRPDEIIIVDNYSSDGTEKVVQLYPVKLLRNKGSLTRSRNLGLRASIGDIIVYLDDDVIVDKNWLKHLLSAYSSSKVGGVGGRILPFGKDKTHFMPACGDVVGKVRNDGVVIANFDVPLKKPIEVDCFQGCNMSFRREALFDVGGFDETYQGIFRHDSDICVAVKKLGYKLIYEPKAAVWHREAGKERPIYRSNYWVYWYTRNSTYFYFKNVFPENKRTLPLFFLRLFFPPRDYVSKSGVKVRLTLSILFTAIRGTVGGILISKQARKKTFLFINVERRNNQKRDSADIKHIFEREYFSGRLGSYKRGYSRLAHWHKYLAFIMNVRFFLKGKKVLDVGCATGSLVYFMQRMGANALGIDISRWAMKNSVSKDLIRGDAEYLPFKNASFNVIIARELIEHLPDPLKFFERTKKVLTENGSLLISTPDGRREKDVDPTHINVRAHNEWMNLLRNNGFSVDKKRLLPMSKILKILSKILPSLSFWPFYRPWIVGHILQKEHSSDL